MKITRKDIAQVRKYLKALKKSYKKGEISNYTVYDYKDIDKRLFYVYNSYDKADSDSIVYSGFCLVYLPPNINTLHTDKRVYLDCIEFKKPYII